MRPVCLILGVLLLAGLVACQVPQQGAEGKPRWIVQPEVLAQASKYIFAVGVGSSGPDQMAKLHEAEHAARGELASRVSDYVADALGQFFRGHTNYSDPDSQASRDFIEIVSTEVSSALLRESESHETWQDPERDAVYVLYRVPISAVNHKIIQKALYGVPEVNPFVRSQEEMALEQLGRFLDSMFRERVAAAAQSDGSLPENPLAEPPPNWRAVGRHPDYPSEKFITAVGLAEGRDEAEAGARASLAEQVETSMSGLYGAITAAGTEGVLGANLRSAGEEALRFTADDLPTTKTAAVWYDPVVDVRYALDVMDRSAAAPALAARMVEATQDAQELFESARNHHRADNYVTALRGYLQAIPRFQEALKWQLAAMAVQPAEAERLTTSTDQVSLAEIKAALRELLDGLLIRKIGGDAQWVAPGVPLAKPLIVGVFAGDEAAPVAELPLSFRFVEGQGVLEAVSGTSEDGTASCVVKKVEPSEEVVGRIECAVAPEKLVPSADLSGVHVPAVTFEYVLRARENTSFALYVDERTLDEALAPERVVRNALSEALLAAGFRVVDDSLLPESALRGELPGDAEAAAVLRVFADVGAGLQGKGFLVVLAGQVHCALVDTADTSVGKLYIVEASVRIRALDTGRPQEPVVLVVEGVGRDAFTDNRNEAARRARVAAADVVSRKLVAALDEKFGQR